MAERARQAKIQDATAVEVVPHKEGSADQELVDQAVAWIKEKIDATVRKGAIEVGEYIIEKFFNNDLDQVRSRNPQKNASFRSLVERCETVDLPISKSALQNAVALAAMCRQIPAKGATFPQLPPSHQTALLPLRDPVRVEKFAQRAASKELSVRDLRTLVTEEVAKEAKASDGRGRPPKPLIVKTLDRSLRLFTLESGRKSFTKAQVDELSAEQAKQALKAAENLVASLTSLIDKLKGKL